ncbi:unnamed protein product [Orchesella dallaii]|uniref:C2H2-type domain-containing protein n=1 Tax=Orchesella dallaii TaxID=48710 RepID=A0ABP1R5J7_9HEXA
MESSQLPSTSRVIITNNSVNMTSTLSDSNSHATSSKRSKKADYQVTNKVTCLLCYKEVPQENNSEVVVEEEMQQLKKLLINIYLLLQVIREIPEVCSNAMFPFCIDCKNIMVNLVSEEEKDERKNKQIFDGLQALRRQLVDGEMYKEELSKFSTSQNILSSEPEKQKFWEFRNIVLQGVQLRYCRLMNQNRDTAAYEPSDESDTKLVSTQSIQIVEPLHSLNLNAQADGGLPAPTESDMSKDSDNLNEANVLNKPIRKLLVAFHGVNMIKCFAANNEFLKCIACFHTESILNSSKDDEAPYTKLKIHTQSSHNIEPVKTPETTAVDTPSSRQEVPSSASKQTKTEEQNFTRRTRRILECEICLRPVQGGQLNLQRHLFSHKNSEEKLAAKAVREKGTYGYVSISKSEKRRMDDDWGNGNPPKILTRTANGVLFQCTICISTFKTENFLALHVQSQHEVATHESSDDENQFRGLSAMAKLALKRSQSRNGTNALPPALNSHEL